MFEIRGIKFELRELSEDEIIELTDPNDHLPVYEYTAIFGDGTNVFGYVEKAGWCFQNEYSNWPPAHVPVIDYVDYNDAVDKLVVMCMEDKSLNGIYNNPFYITKIGD